MIYGFNMKDESDVYIGTPMVCGWIFSNTLCVFIANYTCSKGIKNTQPVGLKPYSNTKHGNFVYHIFKLWFTVVFVCI